MNLFFYTQKETVEENGESKEVIKPGYSFDLDRVIMTYPVEEGLAILLSQNTDKLNPVDYQYKKDPKTGQKYPIKITKFEITSEPVTIQLTELDEINKFFSLVGGPVLEYKKEFKPE